jgi:beta-ribofuranosylaminobenzene 5'-phosphate synthase
VPLRIVAGSRIHLGFYNIRASGLKFGSIGLYLQYPQTIVETGKNGKHAHNEKIKSVICGDKEVPPPHIIARPPSHVGLGSTTQLSLSIAKYYSILCNRKYSVEKLALLTGRGEISGIGIHGFRLGGFIIDTGKKGPGQRIPGLLARLGFPIKWNIVIAIPREKKGKTEDEERAVMEKIDADKRKEKELKIELLNRIIPGIVSRDLGRFCRGVENMQRIMGEIFSPFQQGIFSTEETARLAEMMHDAGIRGVGQSSWGPLAYGFIQEKKVNSVIKRIEKSIYKENIVADIMVTKARNRGATVHVY